MSSPLPLLAFFITSVDYEPLSIHNHPNIDIVVAKFSTYVLLKWHLSWLYSTHANDMYLYHKRVEVANICKVGMDLWSPAHFYLQTNAIMLGTLTMLCCVESFIAMLPMKELLFMVQHYPYPSF
jgi:hypothetical protein